MMMASERYLPFRGGIFACLFMILFSIHLCISSEGKNEDNAKEKWKKKDVRDYTDADLERLFEQWEVHVFSACLGLGLAWVTDRV